MKKFFTKQRIILISVMLCSLAGCYWLIRKDYAAIDVAEHEVNNLPR